jgi:MerR family transcriptional regulator, mercuric resistance operon regulatory protein
VTSRLRSGQVAEAAGVNLQTLRYYERRGLLAEPERSLGGHRLYPEQAVAIVRIIKASQRLGFTLDDVAELLETGRHRHGRRPDASLHAKAVTKLAEIEQRIADLQVIADTLRVAVDLGCDDVIACATSADCPLPFADLAGRAARRSAVAG